ncbi:DUF1501 domain-containing protein [Phycisphaera mikurensis]|uniref:DUF1501 domain-containing protein n=1 Tax=Phycisphaera mikurensis (strain NBRC 102666 / KCTC 22515 / FYK2301M01) TaxID=1142394 RepID=I0IGS8_PHYMF|nr:DUF1501 domain-containing protein [Phycisphaera mikurensis]MBB6443255.1 uncharacterized protein (DUF1501 family) [Phycisphaera mikurensis]BAM04466.1 hypothetical protein PSMK_23070 [Phycisphaera mikurensis NBRC 102666]
MRLTRRFFLRSTGAMAVYCAVNPLDAALAASMDDPAAHVTAKNKTLVVVFLRGGIDGLNLVVPHGDPAYAKLRPGIGVAAPGKEGGALDLDGFFGMNPRAAALMPALASGEAIALQAVGYPGNSRSHFEEQDVWETGVSGNTMGHDGWLNRHLLTSTGHGPIRAVALSDSLPRILRGEAPAFAFPGLTDLGFGGRGNAEQEASVVAALEQAHAAVAPGGTRDAIDLVHAAGRETLEGVKVLRGVAAQPYEQSASYPSGQLGQRLASAARLIKAGVGLEVVQIDYGGWDTHNRQGDGAQGNFGTKVEELCGSLAAFSEDLGPRSDDTLVLTLSDFGRTARQNGTAGTDHGWANAMLAMGGPVAAKKALDPGRGPVMGAWPGLGPEQLHQKRDLKHTTDFRDVLAEVVTSHLGNANLPKVLPGHAFSPVGLL